MILTAEDLRLHLVSRILNHDPARPLTSEMDLVMETISERMQLMDELRFDLLQNMCGVHVPRQRRKVQVLVGENQYMVPILPDRKGKPSWVRFLHTVLYQPSSKTIFSCATAAQALRKDLEPLAGEARLASAAHMIFNLGSVISQLQTSRMVRNARAAAF